MNIDPNIPVNSVSNDVLQQNMNQFPVMSNNVVTLDKFDGVTINTVLRWKQYGKMNVECFLGFNEAATEIDKMRGSEILQTMGHFYCILCECYVRANKKSVGRHQNSNRRHVRLLQEYVGARTIMMPPGQPLKNSFDVSNHQDYLVPPPHQLDPQQYQQHMTSQSSEVLLHHPQYLQHIEGLQSSGTPSYTGMELQPGLAHAMGPKVVSKPSKRARSGNSSSNGAFPNTGVASGPDMPLVPPGQEAWSLISHPNKVVNIARLNELLNQLRVHNGEDLLRCQPNEIVEIIQTLKVVPGRRLLQLFSTHSSVIPHVHQAVSSSSSSS